MVSCLLLPAFAAGHLILLILLINVSHGVGWNANGMDRAVLLILGCLGLATIACGFWLWNVPWREWPNFIQLYAAVCYFTLFLAFPATTLVRSLRRIPAGARNESERCFDLCDAVDPKEMVGSGPGSWPLFWKGNDSFRPCVVEWSVEINGLPEPLDGLSLLHLTDFHFSSAFSRRYFEEILKIAADIPRADFVFLTGDYVDDARTIEWIEPLFSSLHARLGQFAILGNHDYRFPVPPIRSALKGAGFEVLEGCWRTVDIDGSRLAIGGTSYPWGQDIDCQEKPDADATIILSHSPDPIYRAARMQCDLMLCGHNHGGQVRLPVIGPVLMPSLYSRRFDQGFFRVEPTWLYVNKGIGAKCPLRWNCSPEIARIVLRCAKVEMLDKTGHCDVRKQSVNRAHPHSTTRA